MKPGYNTPEELLNIDRRLTRQTAEFISEIQLPDNPICGDVGILTPKIQAISTITGWEFHQLSAIDFNYEDPKNDKRVAFSLITCLETLEHVQNPLFLLDNLRKKMFRDSVLVLSLPGRPRFLWTEHHYHEITPKHLQKWLLDELGMKIVRQKKIRINMPWWRYFTGIRPFMRLFFNFTNIYEIRFK